MNVTLSEIGAVAKFLPEEWARTAADDVVLARAYWCPHPIERLAEDEPIVMELPDDVRAIVFSGALTYFRVRDRYPVLIADDEMDFAGPGGAEAVVQETGPLGAYFLFFTRYGVVDEGIGERVVARIRLNVAAGLAGTIGGRNVIYLQVCEIALRSNGFDADWGVVHSPFVRAQPPPAPALTTHIAEIYGAICAAPGALRERIRLALRWYETSLRQFSVDAFLASWIAVETFSEARNAPHKEIHALMAAAYGTTAAEARDLFRVDRLWKVRNGIVHNGRLIPIMPPIPDYMQALFVDVLLESLNLPSGRKAIDLVDDAQLRLHSRIDEAVAMVAR